MAAPLRNRAFLKRLSQRGFVFISDETHVQLKWIPYRCQNARQYSCVHRLDRLRHTTLRAVHYKKLYSINVIRHASSVNQNDIPPGYIPDIPDVPVVETLDQVPVLAELNALGEPTLQSIGLGSYWPAGLVQNAMEAIHVGLDIPWWSTIMIGVVIVRTCMFPLIVKQRKTLVTYHNISPQVTKIQAEMAEAQAAVDYMEAKKASDKMKAVMLENDVRLRNMFMPVLIQIPVFMSVFWGLKRMAEFPVLSMQTGGCLWFTDLTMSDPIVMLPVITALSMWINLEIGAESMKANAASVPAFSRVVMRVMPLFTLVCTMQFPAALCLYWATSNIFALCVAMTLRVPSVREALGIPKEKDHPTPVKPPRKTGVMKRFKDAYKTTSKLSESTNRKQIEDTVFKRSTDEMLLEDWSKRENVVRPTRNITEAIEDNQMDKNGQTEVKERQKL